MFLKFDNQYPPQNDDHWCGVITKNVEDAFNNLGIKFEFLDGIHVNFKFATNMNFVLLPIFGMMVLLLP